jgi:hypothetical protein
MGSRYCRSRLKRHEHRQAVRNHHCARKGIGGRHACVSLGCSGDLSGDMARGPMNLREPLYLNAQRLLERSTTRSGLISGLLGVDGEIKSPRLI